MHRQGTRISPQAKRLPSPSPSQDDVRSITEGSDFISFVDEPEKEVIPPFLDTYPPLRSASNLDQLEEELQEFVKANMLSAEEIKARESLIVLLTKLISAKHPGATPVPYGSYATGLGYSEADIDVGFVFQGGAYDSDEVFRDLEAQLSRDGRFCDIHYIASARNPIVKGLHIPYGLRFDVSLPGDPEPVRKSVMYVKRLATRYPLLHPLSIIVKQILKGRKLDEPFYGGLSGYATVILISAMFKTADMRRGTQEPHQLASFKTSHPLLYALLDFTELYGLLFNARDMTVDIRSKRVFILKSRISSKCANVSDSLSIIDPVSEGSNLRDIGGAYSLWYAVRTAFAWIYTMLLLPYDTLRPLQSCNLKDEGTLLERVMRTETLARKVKDKASK